MVIKKFYCDKCKKLIKNDIDAIEITIGAGNFKRAYPTTTLEVCSVCFNKIRNYLGIESKVEDDFEF